MLRRNDSFQNKKKVKIQIQIIDSLFIENIK